MAALLLIETAIVGVLDGQPVPKPEVLDHGQVTDLVRRFQDGCADAVEQAGGKNHRKQGRKRAVLSHRPYNTGSHSRRV